MSGLRQLALDVSPPILTRAVKRVARGWIGDHRTAHITINGVRLDIPASHALPSYRRSWRAYDEPIRLLADAVRSIHPSATAIDIGANIGDTAAAIAFDSRGQPVTSVLCIEGDPKFLPFLRRNAAALGTVLDIEESFVGAAAGSLAVEMIRRHAGTSTAAEELERVQADSEGPTVQLPPQPSAVAVRRLEEIISDWPKFAGARLIKLDTDGFDFPILLGHERLLSQMLPILYYENAVSSASAEEEANRVIDMLGDAGYSDYFVFDNFGNPLLRTGDPGHLKMINRYLVSNYRNGTAIDYVDVCAATAADGRVLDKLNLSADILARFGAHSGVQ